MLVRGDSDNAIRLLRDVVKQDTNHLDAYLQLGDILREQGNSQNAIKIHQSLTVRPGLDEKLQIQIHQSLAQDYLSINDVCSAIKILLFNTFQLFIQPGESLLVKITFASGYCLINSL